VAETLGYNANITYQYDGLKRLISAASAQTGSSPPAAWTETMQYDGLGNLTAKVLNGTATSIPVNGATNRLSNAYYDANGNMTSGAGATLGYDEANRIVSATEYSGGTEYSAYAPDGKRMFRMEADGVTQEWTFWGARGEKLGTFAMVYNQHAGNSAHPYQPVLNPTLSFAGRTIWDGGKPLVQDRIGTNRATGARYYPFGDEITSTANDATKFGTYHRDGFTGLDYADQRYFASTYGRFNTADPYRASGRARSPLSWNRYGYTRGDPINRFDLRGLEDQSTDANCVVIDADDTYDCGTTFYGGTEIDDDSSDDSGDSASGTDPSDPVSGPVDPTKAGSPAGQGPQPLDPNSQECQDLARKIANIQRDIAEMQNRIDVNPGGLPITAVGPPSASIQGHQQILAAYQANLTAQLALYAQKCGGGAPPAVPVRPPVILPPGTKYPPIKKPSPVTIGIGVGVGVAIICGLLPEACAIAAPVLAW
jgi:RHS repeat-associated protein